MGKTYNQNGRLESKTRPERRKWCAEEDVLLQKSILKHGTKNWGVIAACIPGRHPKQCRERWINHLDPQITKGKISDEEWELVLKTHTMQGNRWSEIAKLLPGRTPNQIKNYWHTMARRNLKLKKGDEDGEEFAQPSYHPEQEPPVPKETTETEIKLTEPSITTSTVEPKPFCALVATAEELYYLEKEIIVENKEIAPSQKFPEPGNLLPSLSIALGPTHSQNLPHLTLSRHNSHNSRSGSRVGTPYGTPLARSRSGTPISTPHGSKSSSPISSRHNSPFSSRSSSPARSVSPPHAVADHFQPHVTPAWTGHHLSIFPQTSCQSSFRQTQQSQPQPQPQLQPSAPSPFIMSEFDAHIQMMEKHLFQRFAL